MEQISQSAHLYRKQIELEENAIDAAVRHYSRQMGQKEAHLPAEFAFLGKVFPQFEAAIKDYQKEGRGKPSLAKQVLQDIPAKDAAFLTLNSIIHSVMGDRGQVPIQKVAAGIGADLYDHVEYLRFVEKCKENGSKAHKWVQENSKTASEWRRRAAIKKAAEAEGCELPEVLRREALRTVPEERLSNLDEFRVGEKVVDILMTSTDMFQFAGGTSKAGNSCLYLKPSEKTEEWLNDLHTMSAISRPKYLPCVIPPREWKDLEGGGYYLKRGKSRLPLLRTRNRRVFEVNAGSRLDEVFNALNGIQNTGWRVNRKVLEVLKAVYMPSVDSYIPLPMAESEWEAEFKKATLPRSFTRNLRQRKEAFQRITSEKSKAYATKKTVEIAAQMKDFPIIYFPHNLDYRGRCYPVPSYLNPQGDDTAKGLLEFAKGHPLGERGAYWLAVHGSNSWGHGLDKAEFKDRYQWVLDNTQTICDVAQNPLENDFWQGAENPCSFLAFCFEWDGYQREGESFKSHLSIDMDGTCNGLQHLSALLRDERGGALVNLVPVEKPSDVYTNVMEYVSATVEKDSEAGNKLAKLWAGKVDRKLVKRPVMTQGYGVTPSGIKNQLSKEVSKRTGGEWNAVKTSGFEAYGYLGGVIDGSIAEAMPGVFVVKNWLREVAAKFTEKNLPIQWKTPTGLVVLQQNFKQKQVQIKSFYGVAKVRNAQNPSRITLNQDTDKLDKTEQMNALVPNVIHSLDAAHLMKTVNACAAKGVTDFHAIHDSYGVHACFVDDLHRITREEFVKLYQGDVLEDLRHQFEAQLGEPLEGVEWRGNLDINWVLSAEYFWA